MYRFLADQVSQDFAGGFACVGDDIDAFEIIRIAWIGLDLGLGRRAGERQRSLNHVGHILEFHQPPQFAEVLQVCVAEIQHADAVTEHACALVHHDAALGFFGGHGGQPL